MTRFDCFLAIPVLLLGVIFAGAVQAEGDRTTAIRPETGNVRESGKVKGMTVSCATWGWEWGTDEMVETMRELRGMGVNWITIHPYARIRGDGEVSNGYQEEGGAPAWLTRPIDEAHRLGLKILIKPHLAYWGSRFNWRGEIEFHTDAEWDRFFTTYGEWLAWLVDTCPEADAFVIGTELDKTVRFEKRWRAIIADVRRRTDRPITYAANWSDYAAVPFWDALDVIGIQWYFPVAEGIGMPAPEELRRSWAERIWEVTAFADSLGKKIVLTELGYNRSADAALQPWDYRSGGADAEEVQRRCLAAALDAVNESDSVVGAFLWKWFPGDQRGRNFILSTPTMREVISSHWLN